MVEEARCWPIKLENLMSALLEVPYATSAHAHVLRIYNMANSTVKHSWSSLSMVLLVLLRYWIYSETYIYTSSRIWLSEKYNSPWNKAMRVPTNSKTRSLIWASAKHRKRPFVTWIRYRPRNGYRKTRRRLLSIGTKAPKTHIHGVTRGNQRSWHRWFVRPETWLNQIHRQEAFWYYKEIFVLLNIGWTNILFRIFFSGFQCRNSPKAKTFVSNMLVLPWVSHPRTTFDWLWSAQHRLAEVTDTYLRKSTYFEASDTIQNVSMTPLYHQRLSIVRNMCKPFIWTLDLGNDSFGSLNMSLAGTSWFHCCPRQQ